MAPSPTIGPRNVLSDVGIRVRCFVSFAAAKLTISVALTGLVAKRITESSLLRTADGDSRLLSDGGRLVFAILDERNATLRQLWLPAFLMALLAWVVNQWMTALSFRALARGTSPFIRPLAMEVVRVMLRFSAMSVAFTVAVTATVYGFFLLLPNLGTVFLPLFGERATDLFELALFGLAAIALFWLRITLDLLRAQLAAKPSDLRDAWNELPETFRGISLSLVGQAASRLGIATAAPMLGLWLELVQLRTFPGSTATPLSLLLVEAGSALGIWLYLGWVRCAFNAMSLTTRTTSLDTF